MPKLNTLKASTTSRVLIFGPPKSGKSQLAGTLAEEMNLIWIDLENGHDVLFKLPESQQERIEVISLPDTRAFPIAIETCLKIVKGKSGICTEHGKVSCMLCKKEGKEITEVDVTSLGPNDCIVFDSITQLTNSAIAHITKGEPEDYKLNYDDWAMLGVLMDTFFSYIQQAGYNVVAISHEVEAETEGKKNKLVPVAGTRNFSRNVAKYFDHVIYAEVKNKKHIFASSTTYANNILTGSRSDVSLEERDGSSLLPLMRGEVGKSTQQSVPSQKQSTSEILARMKAKK